MWDKLKREHPGLYEIVEWGGAGPVHSGFSFGPGGIPPLRG